jgi:predicted ATPase/DNA-binding CsgD family transcriptional regulator
MEPPPRYISPLSDAQQHASLANHVPDPGALPVLLTSFVGREDEIDLARSLLQRPDLRLLTLTGPGGIGKTRLAIEIATESGALFPDGVRFVPLASIQDPSMVMMAVAVSLGLQEFDGPSIEDIVASSLGMSSVLLVVDNFEHVMDAAPALTRVLARCPRLKIVVTSRSLLRVEGEHALPVPTLTVPRTKATMTADDWLRVPVIALFIERAGAVDPSLAWNPGEIMRLVEICERLDGLPLAVELAATRVRHFSLAEINDRLTGLLPLLVDGSRDHPTRLQTMRNAIAWSFDLLSPETRETLRHASVFRGGFTLEAIAEVTSYLDAQPSHSGAGSPGNRAIDAELLASIEERLSRLIDDSLLIRETGPVAGATRYRMLETIREFAQEQLQTHGEEERARRGHATYFTTYAVRHEIAELIPEHVHSMDQLNAEQDNLRSALMWLLESSDRALLGRLVAALGRFWLAQSNYQEGRTWFERALAFQPAVDPADAARILVALGMAELFQEENEAAEAHLAPGVTACREHGEAHGAALALIGLAGLAVARGDGERSRQLLGESLAAATAIPDARLAGILSGWVSINLAVVARTEGDGEAAERHIEDALGRFRAEQFHVGTMMALGDLGDLARDRGDWTRALALYKEALAAGRSDQAKRIVIEIIESVGIVSAHAGSMERSATLLGAAEGLRDRIGLRYRQPRNRLFLEEAIDTTRRGLPIETFSAAWATGRNLSASQAIAEVLNLPDSTGGSNEYALTARESEVLQLLATGMTDPEIADALFISVRTVEHHVASVFRKFDVRTRAAATSTAIAAGLVPAGGAA